MEELLSLKWNNHHSIILDMFKIIREKELYTDVTLVCEGKFYNVHKVVLATCSLYFNEIFSKLSCSNPVIILREIKCEHLEYLLDYMYIGEVKVKQLELNYLIKTAEHLKIKGLAAADSQPILTDNDADPNDLINDAPDYYDDKIVKRKRPLDSSVTKKRRRSREKRDIDIDTFMTTELSELSDLTSDLVTAEREVNDIKTETGQQSDNEFSDSEQKNNYTEDAFEYPASFLSSSAENTTDDPYSLPGGSDEFKLLDQKYDSFSSTNVNETEYSSSVAKNMSSERKVICRVCGKKMKWPSQLLVHMRTHTGEKPFHCTKCDKTFSQKIHRKRHMLIRHNINAHELDEC